LQQLQSIVGDVGGYNNCISIVKGYGGLLIMGCHYREQRVIPCMGVSNPTFVLSDNIIYLVREEQGFYHQPFLNSFRHRPGQEILGKYGGLLMHREGLEFSFWVFTG